MHRNTQEACFTLDAGEYNPGVIIGDDISVAVLWFVDLQVGVFPCELLSRVDGLQDAKDEVRTTRQQTEDTEQTF